MPIPKCNKSPRPSDIRISDNFLKKLKWKSLFFFTSSMEPDKKKLRLERIAVEHEYEHKIGRLNQAAVVAILPAFKVPSLVDLTLLFLVRAHLHQAQLGDEELKRIVKTSEIPACLKLQSRYGQKYFLDFRALGILSAILPENLQIDLSKKCLSDPWRRCYFCGELIPEVFHRRFPTILVTFHRGYFPDHTIWNEIICVYCAYEHNNWLLDEYGTSAKKIHSFIQ